MTSYLVDTPNSPGVPLSGAGDTLLVTSQGSILVNSAPSSGIGTAISATGNDEAATLDGAVYCAYTSSGTVAGDGVYLDGSQDTLTVDSTVQGGTSAVQVDGTDAFIDVGSLGALQGLGSTSWGLGINGGSAETNDTLLNLGTITGTTGIGISSGGGDSITNGGTISGTVGINYKDNVALEYIENSGMISGPNGAIESIGSSAGVDIVNSGLITSSTVTIDLDDAMGATSNIDNKGTILGPSTGGAIFSYDDTLQLTNSGTIHGGIGIGADSSITNSGTIVGGVSLGNDGTLIDSGTVTGGTVACLGTGDEVSLYGGGTIANIACGTSTTIHDIRGTIDAISMAASDTVDYQGPFGEQTITGFVAGSGSTHDTLSFAANDFGSFTALSKHMTQVGSDTVITRDSDDSITLVGVTKTNLVAADFTFT
jgi:hypothetical protein